MRSLIGSLFAIGDMIGEYMHMDQALPGRHTVTENSTDMRVSVVIPVRDEALSIPSLTEGLTSALADWAPFEIIYVDDGSIDDSPMVLKELCRQPPIRAIRHAAPAGQSAAIRTGVLAARAAIIVTLDGDGQNDPLDIPGLLEALLSADQPRIGLVQGERTGRKDTPWKRLTSRLANGVRRTMLRDGARDSGCGLRAFPRQTYLALPFFDHLHRFMPALVLREGYEVIFLPVSHHPRQAGSSHYGTLDRLFAGFADLIGVWWLRRRRTLPDPEELDE